MCDKCKAKKFICECGKEFDTAGSLGSHKVHCKIHLTFKIQKDNLEKEKRRLPNGMFKCDNPECQNEHDGSYGSGRFCSKHCKLSFIAKEAYKTKVQNGTFKSGFSEFNLKRRAPYGTWKCEQCNLIFKTRAQLEEHCLKANHTHQIIEISKFMFRCPFCDYTGNKNQVAAHLVSCKNHPNKEKYDLAHKKAGKSLSENIKSGKIKASWKGRHHTEESKRKLSLKGGKREHSGRGKQGRYCGIWCDSSWELAWIIYQKEHNIQFTRYSGYFEYEFEGKLHKYYPDFELIDGTIVEIKGADKTLQWKAKLEQFPKDKTLVILNKESIKPYLDYAINKYGKDFIQLYE